MLKHIAGVIVRPRHIYLFETFNAQNSIRLLAVMKQKTQTRTRVKHQGQTALTDANVQK